MNKHFLTITQAVIFILSVAVALLFIAAGITLIYYGFSQLTLVPITWFNFLFCMLIGGILVKWGCAAFADIFS